jgi:hypothetical protein
MIIGIIVVGGAVSAGAAIWLGRHEARNGRGRLRPYLVAISACGLGLAFLVGLLRQDDCQPGCGFVSDLTEVTAILSGMFLVALLIVAPLVRLILARAGESSGR